MMLFSKYIFCLKCILQYCMENMFANEWGPQWVRNADGEGCPRQQ